MDLFLIVSFFISFIVGITIHETAHAWMGNKLGDPTAKDLGRISLNPLRHIDPLGSLALPIIALVTSQSLIGWAKPTPFNPANLKELKKDELLIAIAGPISNLLLASVCLILVYILAFLLGFLGVSENLLNSILDFVYYIAIGNLILAFFNLLPIPPLDGATFLKIFLPHRFGAHIDYFGQYGFFILMFASFTPAGNILGNYIDACVGFCLRIFGFV